MRKLTLALVCMVPLCVAAQEVEPERIELIPQERAAWTPRNIGARISALFRGSDYWYSDREVLVETVPAGAVLSMYFIRSNFQKRFERARAPVRLVTPRRIDSTSRDVIKVRAAADGYESREVSFRAFEVPDGLVIELEPLPNSLVSLGHTHLAGRSALVLRTTEEPALRISRRRGADGFTLALSQTAQKLSSQPAVSSGHVRGIEIDQVGEDLIVRIATSGPDLEIRSRSSVDPVRDEHVYVIELMRPGTRPPSAEQVRRELELVPYERGARCDRAFARVLRAHIDASVLARAFRRSGGVAELYRREAMLRLGRLDFGRVETLDGASYRTGSSVELALALESAGAVRDYFGLLGAVARTRPDPAEFLRALLAPELSADEFAPVLNAAEQSRAACS